MKLQGQMLLLMPQTQIRLMELQPGLIKQIQHQEIQHLQQLIQLKEASLLQMVLLHQMKQTL